MKRAILKQLSEQPLGEGLDAFSFTDEQQLLLIELEMEGYIFTRMTDDDRPYCITQKGVDWLHKTDPDNYLS